MSRGRADAELTYGEENQSRTDEFEAKQLDPAQFADPEESRLVGIGASAPTVEANGEAGGSAGGEAAPGAATWRRRLSPHHRRAVGEFFSSSTSSGK